MLIRRLKALAALLCLSLLVLGASMCGGGTKTDKPAVVEGIAKLTLSASPAKLPADGATTDITVLAVQEDGTNGNGPVDLQATNGSLNGGGNATTVTLTNGRVSVKWNCDQTAKSSCPGTQTVTATWGAKTATTTVEFTATTGVTDSGVADTGPGPTDAQADATLDGASDASLDAPVEAAPIVQGTLAIAASKAKVYIATGDFSTLTATVKQLDGGPIANEPVSFTTDLGVLSSDGGVGGAATVGSTTAANGTAQVTLRDNATAGTATVVVTRPATSQTAQTTVAILAAQTITYGTTKCGGLACTIMGTKGSGYNESANVTFKVQDANNNPVPNLTVTFSITNPPTGTTVTATGTTDSSGVATATVTPGLTIGTFDVTATITTPAGLAAVSSPTIGLRGALPSNNGFTFSCARVNIDAYDAPVPPLAATVTCSVKLVDRYGNSVGTGTSVNFKTEAGTLPVTAATQSYTVGGNNTAEGTASVTFNTAGVFPAQDVTPLAAALGQYPNNRDLEPSYMDGLVQRNPRDGLVSLLAYVQGEEHFSDDNQNGVRDMGEQFIDQGEPFVDADDSGSWNAGEQFIDVNGNFVWDGPNGTWDAHTTVWAETRVLYTAIPLATKSTYPSSFTNIAAGGSQAFSVYFRDLNLNYISATATTVTEMTSTRTLTASVGQALSDRYGFGVTRLLVASPGELQCSAATPVCKWKYVFTQWAGTLGGSAYNVTVSNPSPLTPLGSAATVRFKATLAGTTLALDSTGTVGP